MPFRNQELCFTNLAVIQKVIYCEPTNLLSETCSGPCIRFPTI